MNTSRLVAWFGRHGIYQGWVIVAVMFVALFISLGFRFAFGVFYSAIRLLSAAPSGPGYLSIRGRAR